MPKQPNLPDAEYEHLMKCAFRSILANSVDCIFIKDKNIICRAASDSFLRLMDSTPDQLYGHPDSELFDKGLADHYRMDDLGVIRDGKVIVGKVENALPDGEKERWGRTHKFPVRDENGKIIGLVGISSDFTAQHKLDEQTGITHKSDELLNNIPGGCGISHFENGFFYTDMISDGLFLIPYITPDIVAAATGPYFINAVYEPDRSAVVKEYERVKSSSVETGSADFRVYGSDGRLHWLNMMFRRAYILNGVQYYYVTYGDIDSRKRAELELLKARQMYDSAALEAKLIIWEYDPQKRQAVMMQGGYTSEICEKLHVPEVIENVPDTLLPFVDERDKDLFRNIYRKIDAGEACSVGEFHFQMPGQDTQQYERITLRRIEDDNGNLLTVHCCGQNITLQKQAQSEYDRLRKQITENMVDVVGSFQLNLSQNLYISGYSPYPSVVKSLEKKTADEHFAATACTVINEEIKQQIMNEYTCAHLTELFRKGQRQLDRDYPVWTSGGGVMWVHSTLYIMQNPGTGDIEGITYSKDVTKQKRNEEIIRLVASENCEYIGIVDTVARTYERHSGTWLVGTAEGQKFPYDTIREEMVSKFLTPDEAKKLLAETELPIVTEALNNAPRLTVSFRFRTGSDGTAPIKQISFCWLSAGHREILVTQQDITAAYEQEQKRTEQLSRAMLEAEHANDMKTEFLSNLSHDMRTPLNAVLGYANFASQSKDPAEKDGYLEKISKAGNILLTLINDTLDLSKIESGEITLKSAPISCGEVISRMVSSIRPEAEKKHIRFTVDNSRAVMATINIDALRVQEIFINLLSNAVKFTPEYGEVTMVIECTELEADCIHDRVTIRDTGCGISPEFLPKMFEPFTQERTGENAGVGGSGLGLSIVKRLVDLMGGTIEVHSEPGKGTEFIVCLDFERVDGKLFTPEQSSSSQNSLAGLRVLLCEDNAMNREIALKLLEFRGVSAECAENGQIGLDLYSASPSGYFDAVLMDVRMPVMDGLTAARAIRALDRSDAKTIPIFAMTADAFDDDVRKCLDAGMNAHISKPIDPETLYRALNGVLQDTHEEGAKG